MRHNRTDAFSDQLPSVGGGMQINAEHVNRLSRAVERNQIKSIIGGRGIARGPRGTALLMGSQKRLTKPFEVTVNGSGVIVREGRVWSSAGNFAYGNSGTLWGNNINYSTIAGAELIMEDVNYWYWPHQEKTKDYIVWLNASGPFTNPSLQYSEITLGSPLGETEAYQRGYPIALVRSSLSGKTSVGESEKAAYDVFQIMESDIFYYDDSFPFKINPYLDSFDVDLAEGGTASVIEIRATINYGLINNVEPTYTDGRRISEAGASISLVSNPPYGSGGVDIYLEVEIAPKPSNVPVKAKVKSVASGQVPASNSTYGILVIGRIDYTYIKAEDGQPQQPPSISTNNALRASLWCEAHKYVPSNTDYYFYRL